MAKVKCEYCGNYIEETNQICPNCGAVNANYQRTAHDTPQTIAELQSWYRARNLPPEETTRFFIGKNVFEPKAFGIYEDHGVFTVYKNKANGQRAIRYQGTDEAYAVNELYLKLKEEILRQKSVRLSPDRSNAGSSVPMQRSAARKAGPAWKILLLIFGVIMIVIFSVTALLSGIRSRQPKFGYYLQNDTLYFYEGYAGYDEEANHSNYRWWRYDESAGDWAVWQDMPSDEKFPEPLSRKSVFTPYLPFARSDAYTDEQYDIYKSHAYIDLHHYGPSSDYYRCDDRVYFFLNDSYGGYYGDTTNQTGWYTYDEDHDTWSYYCDENDKQALGDELWYNAESYHLTDADRAAWDTSFYDTEFYRDYQTASDAHDAYWEEHSSHNDSNDNNSNDNSWDNDNDYDWDNDWDWDDGGDWDSDW